MRRIRWKSKYLTGEPKSDDRNKRLVAILHELYESLRAKEHCQDMEELYGDLAELTERRLSSRELAASGAASDDAVGRLIRSGLPLEALDTPACRHCDLCDLTETRVTNWLAHDQAVSPPTEAAAA